MRRLLIVIGLAACGGTTHLHFKPLPELVATTPPTTAIAIRELTLIPGERIIWDVQAKGFSIARAELVVGDGTVTSHVETNALASAVANVSHELSTVIDPETGLPRSSSETVNDNGTATKIDVAYNAKGYAVVDQVPVNAANVHDIHTALGVLRTWVAPDAHAGYLDVLADGKLFRLEANQPLVSEVAGKSALRVDCRVLPADHKTAIAMSIWFAPTSDHTPMRFEIQSDKGRVAADLVERTTGTESR